MPSVGHYKVYAPAEPCTYKGDKLKEVIKKILDDKFKEGSKELNLEGCCIGAGGLAVLLEDPRLAEVKRLNLGGNQIKNEGAAILGKSSILSKLNWLELGGNGLEFENGIRPIVNSKGLGKLKTLNLCRNNLSDAGVTVLAKENKLLKLEELDLAWNEIGDQGTLDLSRSTNFPNLVAVYLDNNLASADARDQAKLEANFKKLQSLNI